MQYQKLISGETIIEFHNNWLGVETVIANGRIVSKQSSIWGVNHYFTVMEDGHQIRYVLTSKLSNTTMEVQIDLSRNGEPIHQNVPVSYSSKSKPPFNRAKKEGMTKLSEYELEDALEAFERALGVAPKDPEIYFHMACAHSVQEEAVEAFQALQKAFSNGLHDTESVLNHDMLAYVRMNEAFSDFLNSGFKSFDKERVRNGNTKI